MTFLMVSFNFLISILILLLLLASGKTANYVILSTSKEGLREVRIAYKNKLVMEVSLADVPSANGIVFSRATDGQLLVETVSRHGLIEDCNVLASSIDVASFTTDFERVQPELKLRSESEVMDVYMGKRNLSTLYSRDKHLTDRAHPQTTSQNLDFKWLKQKLTAKLGAVSNSTFLSSFLRYLRIKRLASDCNKYYQEAQSRLEALNLLVENSEALEQESLRLHLDESRVRKLFGKRQHRRRHHHPHPQHHELSNGAGASIINATSALPDPLFEEVTSVDFQVWMSSPADRFDWNNDTRLSSANVTENQMWINATSLTAASLSSSISHSSTLTESTSNLSILSSNSSTSTIDSLKSTSNLLILSTNLSTSRFIYQELISDTSISSSNSSTPTSDSQESTSNSSILSSNSSISNISLLSSFSTLSSQNASQQTLNGHLPNDHMSGATDSIENRLKTAHSTTDSETLPGSDVSFQSQHHDAEATHPINATSGPDTTGEMTSRSRPKRDLLTGWMIFPGTKWCGDGDIAENKHDLGHHVELDKCCRRHDLCPLVIPRLSWKYGMFNYRLHTISHCKCDR
ncbi:Group 3 secretory phospholipase A2, partial [Biomphalaria pfeifferi]